MTNPKRFTFEQSARAWGTQDFDAALKRELAQYAPKLPLHQALLLGTQISDEPVSVMINSITENAGLIHIRAGIFFKGLLVGCSCSDDPSGLGESNEYCEADIELNRLTETATVLLR